MIGSKKPMRQTIFLAMAAILLSTAGPAVSQPAMTVWSGVYTDDQAARGATLYQSNCVMCHGATLQGNGEAPPLVGRFIPDWQGTSLADLFEKIHDTMPLFAPGSLSPDNTGAILAFVLKSNGFPAGTTALSVDGAALKQIGFVAVKPVAATGAKPR